MKALVTGGLGFIGSNLATRLLELGFKVTIFDAGSKFGGNNFNIHKIRKKINLVHGDITNFNSISKNVKDFDYIFCCAGQVSSINSLTNPSLDLEINGIGNLNLLQACKINKVKSPIIFLSSRTVYGAPKYNPVDENHPTFPFDGYGISKLTAENYFKLFHQHYGLNTCILRLSNVYGPKQQLKTGNYQIIGWIYRRIALKEPLTIYGTGNQARDFIFVDDVINAMIGTSQHIEKCAGEIFNVGYGSSYSLNSLINKISKVTDSSCKILHKPHPKARKLTEIKTIKLDWSKINKRIGWKPKISIETGLRIMHNFYSDKKILSKYS